MDLKGTSYALKFCKSWIEDSTKSNLQKLLDLPITNLKPSSRVSFLKEWILRNDSLEKRFLSDVEKSLLSHVQSSVNLGP